MKNYTITVNGQAYDVQVEEKGAGSAATASAPVQASAPVAAPKAAPASAGAEKVTAPMPCTILDIKVKVGDSVKRGDTLVILEAMKMENSVVAPRDAVIASVNVAKGDNVDSGTTLVTIN
ncbi:MAG: biotin/lipoyl-binding protein [Clostridiales bacterium]|nr:biotin/lipoyl-binding protein [Clostridiales bacterium]